MANDWYKNNEELLNLLKKEQVPTPEEVIAARNVLWKKGYDTDMNLFTHLIELAVLHEAKRKNKD